MGKYQVKGRIGHDGEAAGYRKIFRKNLHIVYVTLLLSLRIESDLVPDQRMNRLSQTVPSLKKRPHECQIQPSNTLAGQLLLTTPPITDDEQ